MVSWCFSSVKILQQREKEFSQPVVKYNLRTTNMTIIALKRKIILDKDVGKLESLYIASGNVNSVVTMELS